MKNIRMGLITFAFCYAITVQADDIKSQTTSHHNNSLTASISQGKAIIKVANLYECQHKKGRNAPVGEVKSQDDKKWIVPAQVSFTNNDFPFASDLSNPCTGVEYHSADEALKALDGSDIVEVDSDGEVITAYVFADNYFEMYINGVPVGKDTVPFTQFNSNIVRFKVKRPFSIAMKLVDWEENSGLGSESNRGHAYHPGDGGMVAVFTDSYNNIIAKTDEHWKAQTFYTAPIQDLSCVVETGTARLTQDCSTESVDDGSQFYALHWDLPTNWYKKDFDDSQWQNATTFSNDTIGVKNKSAYTNFTEIFDNPANDAQFIWSSNVVLDNEVIVRFTVE